MSGDFQALTEKEKQTLRLMGRGHDAKSMARHLGLSVHTVNDRLRVVRRKLSVSSSREAARILLDSEGEDPNSVGDKILGKAEAGGGLAQATAAIDYRGQRAAWVIAGVVIMSLIIGATALLLLMQSPSTQAAPAVQAAPVHAEIARTARDWLTLLDAGNWEESYRATGQSFRSLNTVQMWADASEAARAPLGAMRTRADLSQEWIPAPPNGYEMVKFRTDFANKAGVIETVTLAREGQSWKVVGIRLN